MEDFACSAADELAADRAGDAGGGGGVFRIVASVGFDEREAEVAECGVQRVAGGGGALVSAQGWRCWRARANSARSMRMDSAV